MQNDRSIRINLNSERHSINVTVEWISMCSKFSVNGLLPQFNGAFAYKEWERSSHSGKQTITQSDSLKSFN